MSKKKKDRQKTDRPIGAMQQSSRPIGRCQNRVRECDLEREVRKNEANQNRAKAPSGPSKSASRGRRCTRLSYTLDAGSHGWRREEKGFKVARPAQLNSPAMRAAPTPQTTASHHRQHGRSSSAQKKRGQKKEKGVGRAPSSPWDPSYSWRRATLAYRSRNDRMAEN